MILALVASMTNAPQTMFGFDANMFTVTAPAATRAQAVPNPRFVAVEGGTLEARRAAAIARGRAEASVSHFWVAYAFDVRPGVAVDLEVRGANGEVISLDGVTFQNGSKVETRNLAVFLLYERNTDAPDRVEVYNLDRQRGYDGYPVYWLGRATADESFALLQGLLQSQPSGWVAERAVVAIGLHDDPRAADLLEGIVRQSRVERARTTAVMWLGIVADRVPFLAELVRDEREDLELRKQAAMAIGVGRSASAVATLRGLYDSVTNRDVREQLIVATGVHGEENAADDEAVDFLIRVADTDPDRTMRRQAIFWLSQKAGRRSLDALVERASGAKSADEEVQKQAVFALSQRPKDEAVPILMKLARTHQNPEVRRMAIFWLGQIDDERVVPFLKELLSH
jgi:HEAT repeat protein